MKCSSKLMDSVSLREFSRYTHIQSTVLSFSSVISNAAFKRKPPEKHKQLFLKIHLLGKHMPTLTIRVQNQFYSHRGEKKAHSQKDLKVNYYTRQSHQKNWFLTKHLMLCASNPIPTRISSRIQCGHGNTSMERTEL